MEAMIDNRHRAERALTVLWEYRTRYELVFEDAETALRDLLPDLHHLCDMLELDWEAALGHGEYQYAAELEEEDTLPAAAGWPCCPECEWPLAPGARPRRGRCTKCAWHSRRSARRRWNRIVRVLW